MNSTPNDPDRPFVMRTVPADGEFGVPLTSWIYLDFSHSMNTSNTIVHIDPPVALTWRWLSLNATLLLTHATAFAPCTTYWVFVDGLDENGESLLLGRDSPGPPIPWLFTTACSVFAMTRTDPAANQTGVIVNDDYHDFVIWFTRPADPAALQLTLTPNTPLTPVWSNGNTKVTMRHASWLLDCTWHTATVSARDPQGNPLSNTSASPPNPWIFRTVCIQPRILTTEPADGVVDVDLAAPITVRFSEPMNATSVLWAVDPSSVPFTENWTDENKVLTLTHALAFPRSTTYTVTISGEAWDGDLLVPGPAPNPWSFTTTDTVAPPRGLHVARAPSDSILIWNPVPWAAAYGIYASEDRFAPWPWPQIGEVTGTRYVHQGADDDGASHFYLVRARDFVGGESGNSTMGALLSLDFSFNPTETNVHWVSLPYRSPYSTAKAVSDALTDVRIDVVGKYDAGTQRTALWYHLGGEWRGANFPIGPGDGIFISIRSSFRWGINGTDGPVSRSIAWNPPPLTSFHQLALPATSTYDSARAIVIDIERDTGAGANTKIVEVGKWDGLMQTLLVFRWTPTGWQGVDFAVAPGEGIYLRVVSTFTWTPALLTPEVP